MDHDSEGRVQEGRSLAHAENQRVDGVNADCKKSPENRRKDQSAYNLSNLMLLKKTLLPRVP
jgi:hypothetical protein